MTYLNVLPRNMGRITDVVKNLLIINVIVFVGTMGLPDHYRQLGALYFPMSEDFKPYQLITSMFMHENFRHILFNMLALFFLGPMVEQVLGPKRFFILYFASAFGAILLALGIDYALFYYNASGVDPSLVTALIDGNLYQNQTNANNIVPLQKMANILGSSSWGASGATFGVTAAFATLFPNLKLMLLFPPIPVKAKYLVLAFIGIAIISGIFNINSGIGHWAHVGGAVLGFVMIKYYWKLQSLR